MAPQVLFSLGRLSINLYTLLYVLGYLPAFGLGIVLARQRGYSFSRLLAPFFLCILAAAVLARLINALIGSFVSVPITWSLGQIVAVLCSMLVYTRLAPPGPATPAQDFDLLAPPVALYKGADIVWAAVSGASQFYSYGVYRLDKGFYVEQVVGLPPQNTVILGRNFEAGQYELRIAVGDLIVRVIPFEVH